MHEEWMDTRRHAVTEVQLTEAEELRVTKAGSAVYAPGFTAIYRPYRIEVSSSWPNNKIGNAQTGVHIYANEVYFNGVVSVHKVTLLVSDLDEVPDWLTELVLAAEAKNFG